MHGTPDVIPRRESKLLRISVSCVHKNILGCPSVPINVPSPSVPATKVLEHVQIGIL